MAIRISIVEADYLGAKQKLENVVSGIERELENMKIAEITSCESMMQNYEKGLETLKFVMTACNEFNRNTFKQLKQIYDERKEIDETEFIL